MRAELHLARRYLIGLRRRTHIATVTLISLTGLALGVLALVVTLALLDGFQSTIRAELIARTAHARVRPDEGRRLTDAAALVRRLRERLGLEPVEVVNGTCLVEVRGESVPAVVSGRSDVQHPEVDRTLAARLGIGAGDQVQVISPRQRLTPFGPLPVRAALEVATVLPARPGEESGTVLLPLAQAQRLLWGRPVVQALELRDPADPWGLGRRVRHALAGVPGLAVDGVEDLHRPLLLALALERTMIFLAVGLMLVVAALNLLCNVAMVAAEKRADLAVLAGLGLPPRSLRGLFVLLGLGIGIAGSVAGATLGVIVSLVLDRTHALPLPRGVFIVSSVPFRVEPGMVAGVLTLAVVLAALASLLPARSAARRDPLEGLRYE